MFSVVVKLVVAPAGNLGHGGFHRAGGGISIKDHMSLDVSGRPSHGLDEGGLGPKETLLISIQNGNEGYLRQVQPLPQKVDADQNVKIAFSQIIQNIASLKGRHIRVQVGSFNIFLLQVIG